MRLLTNLTKFETCDKHTNYPERNQKEGYTCIRIFHVHDRGKETESRKDCRKCREVMESSFWLLDRVWKGETTTRDGLKLITFVEIEMKI